jgi:tetratricopeptide (TPR) repeat protein
MWWHSSWAIGTALVLLTIIAFAPVLKNGFVNYDDPDYVTSNYHVQGGLNWPGAVWAFTTGHASNWHPITWLSHMTDWALFGAEPMGHHISSLVLHIANSLLLFFLLRRISSCTWRAAMVAALFAVHPVHVESVAWISERKDVLSTFFFLITLLMYSRYAVSRSSASAKTGDAASRVYLFYALALLAFALGLMSKPMLVTGPFVLLLLDVWPLGRVKSDELKAWIQSLTRLTLEKLPFFALSIASCVVTFIVQKRGGSVSIALPLGDRLANAIISYVRYLGKILWPTDLSVLYPHPGHWPLWQAIICAVVLLAISGFVWRAGLRRPYLPVGWAWFVGTLIPVIGVIQVGIQSMADRYTYIPAIGVFVCLVWGVAEWFSKIPSGPKVLGWASAVVLVVCTLQTNRQAAYWHDSETLFKRAVLVTKGNYLAYNNIGYYLANLGRTAEALENYKKSLAINPQYEDALNNIGFILAGQGKHSEALGYYQAALRSRPEQPEVHNNLGNALSELGRLDEAMAQYEATLRARPDHPEAHNNLGIALAMKGRLEEAIPHFRKAIQSKPSYASAHSNLGNAFAAQNKLPEAIQEYEMCLRLNPDDPQAHNNLGNAFMQQGRVDDAVRCYEKALALRSNNPEAHYNLGLALAKRNEHDKALRHFRAALELKPDYAQAREQVRLLESRR